MKRIVPGRFSGATIPTPAGQMEGRDLVPFTGALVGSKIVLLHPVAGHSATASIERGSAIIGRPDTIAEAGLWALLRLATGR